MRIKIGDISIYCESFHLEKTIVTFKEDTYISENTIGKTEFYYNNINVVAETDDYFVFVFHPNHAQIYDKKRITKGTVEEFRKFITEKTGKDIQKI